MTRIRLLSVSGKDVVTVPAALGNEGVAAERGVVISGRGRRRPRYLPTRARERTNIASQEEGSTERETLMGRYYLSQKRIWYCSPTSNQVYFTLLFTRAMPWFTLSLARLARLNIVRIVSGDDCWNTVKASSITFLMPPSPPPPPPVRALLLRRVPLPLRRQGWLPPE